MQPSFVVSTLLFLGGFAVVSAQSTTFTYQGRVTSGGSAFSGAGQFKFALVTSTNLSRQATATAVLSGPFVVDYNLTFGGNGYVTAPAVTVSGGGGSGATAHAVISGGSVVDVVPDTAGSGYTSPPTVTIAPPPPSIAFTTFWSNDGTSVNGSEPVATVSVPVSSGLFTVVLGDTTLANMAAIDMAVFSQRKLQLRIWFNDGVNGFAALNPPQELTPTPYAISLLGTLPASQVTGPLSSANLSGIFSGAVNFNNSSNSFAGNGGGLSNVSANALVVIRTNISIVTWGDSQFGQRIVPAGLDSVVAVSAGFTHSLALEADGTVTAWGAGKTNDPGTTIEAGQSIVPAGLGTVAAIAAGYVHSLALKADGTVVAWGRNLETQTNVPAGLNNVVQVSGGVFHSLALKADGTVVAWGTNSHGQLAIPAGLNNVTAISAGLLHNLALRNNGTVVAWGAGQTNDPSSGIDFGQSIVPPGLANVLAVVAGLYHSLALKSDGTVAAWGGSGLGEADVPPGMNHIVALGPGSVAQHVLALRTRATAPVAVLDSDNTFNGSVDVNGDLSASGDVTLGGDIRLNDGNLWLRGGADENNGLGWHGTGKPFGNGTPSGPVLFGDSGGALATIGTNGIQTALVWDSSQHVGINANPSTNATLTLGQQGSPSAILLPGGYGLGAASGIRFHLNQTGGSGSGGGQFVFSDAPSGRDLVTIQSIFGSFFGVGIGTTTPNVRLHVVGDIRLGSTGQFFAPGGTENLRILRGRIAGNGTITTGTGFTAARNDVGIYTVTFTVAFASQPTITATPQVGLARIATCTNVGTGSSQFRTFDVGGSAAVAADQDFHFIAIGPR